jgi:hypothetical protein
MAGQSLQEWEKIHLATRKRIIKSKIGKLQDQIDTYERTVKHIDDLLSGKKQLGKNETVTGMG